MASEISFTLIGLVSTGLAFLIIVPLIVFIVNHLRRKRDVVLLLVANTYITMFAHSLILLLVNVNILRADLYGPKNANISDSVECRLLGFLLFVTFGWCYMSFVVQAFYRFTRVLYPKRKIFQSFKFNVIMIGVQWIIVFLIQLPLYVWPIPIYTLYKMDYYCGIPYEKFGCILYAGMNVFVVPMILLSIIYARLMYFIHQQTPQLLQTQQGKKMQRDVIITRRILFLVNVLTLPGLPNVILAIMSSIDPNVAGAYYMYRIQWLGAAILLFVLSIALVIITPQLKAFVTTGTVHHENQVGPLRQTMKDDQTQPGLTASHRF